MISIATVHEMLGLSLRERVEIQEHNSYLRQQSDFFYSELEQWMQKFDFPEAESGLFIDHFYDVLISGDYEEHFYIINYRQALHWRELGITQGQVMLLLSQFRQLFVHISDKRENTTLARGLCHTVDLGQAIVSSVYQMHAAMLHMKQRTTADVARMRRSFQILAAPEPEELIQAYIDHQNWKIRAYSLALGEPEEGSFPYSTSQCLLGRWLEEGGKYKIPEADLESFLDAHEQVHRLGFSALQEAQAHHPERIVEFLVEMELASDEVSRVLLDQIENEFVRSATQDALTHLPNRRAFDEKLKQNLAFSKRHGFWAGIILIDIDYFKRINDEFGHAIGDKVLKEAAVVLKQAVRQEETVYRWGGEEFAVLTLDKEPESIEQLAERIRQQFENFDFNVGLESPLNLTVSCGALSLNSELDILEHELFSEVDKQLYHSKNTGRNRVTYRTLEAE